MAGTFSIVGVFRVT